jgi:hypothetical protein
MNQHTATPGKHRDDSNGAWGRCILRDNAHTNYTPRHSATHREVAR